jgi:hypothetical protein
MIFRYPVDKLGFPLWIELITACSILDPIRNVENGSGSWS